MNNENPSKNIDLKTILEESNVQAILDQLEAELIGLKPVKKRIKEIAAFLVISKARYEVGIESETPTLHMCFTGNPGTGKTTVALRMADLLSSLGFIRKNNIVSVTRDDLVGQYIGHTAPKTKEVLKKSMGGILFIDEAYYLYRPENEKDYGQESIEILLQVMENQREDLVVILAGYKEQMEKFFQSNPGMSSRIAHHIEFPDYEIDELVSITKLMLEKLNYWMDDKALTAMKDYISIRKGLPHFANGRSIRNALDRFRLRQANRIYEIKENHHQLSQKDLSLIHEEDIRASSVFKDKA